MARESTPIDGVTHLIWQATVDGVPIVDADLRANVAADGRLITPRREGDPLSDGGFLGVSEVQVCDATPAVATPTPEPTVSPTRRRRSPPRRSRR